MLSVKHISTRKKTKTAVCDKKSELAVGSELYFVLKLKCLSDSNRYVKLLAFRYLINYRDKKCYLLYNLDNCEDFVDRDETHKTKCLL